jgi:hypothetical protein
MVIQVLFKLSIAILFDRIERLIYLVLQLNSVSINFVYAVEIAQTF